MAIMKEIEESLDRPRVPPLVWTAQRLHKDEDNCSLVCAKLNGEEVAIPIDITDLWSLQGKSITTQATSIAGRPVRVVMQNGTLLKDCGDAATLFNMLSCPEVVLSEKSVPC